MERATLLLVILFAIFSDARSFFKRQQGRQALRRKLGKPDIVLAQLKIKEHGDSLTQSLLSVHTEDKSEVVSALETSTTLGFQKAMQRLYRLGDAVMGSLQGKYVQGYHITYPGSIATEYMKRTKRHRDIPALIEIVNERVTPELIPPEDTAVVHLRLGDVFSMHFNDKKDPEDAAEKFWAQGSNYVKNRVYYEDVADQMPPDVKRVLIMGSVHHSLRKVDRLKSEAYRGKVISFFEEKGYEVKLREGTQIPGDNGPDNDFIFMTKSMYFVPGGGQFSSLAAICVKENGGKVLTDKKTMKGISPDEGSAKTIPAQESVVPHTVSI